MDTLFFTIALLLTIYIPFAYLYIAIKADGSVRKKGITIFFGFLVLGIGLAGECFGPATGACTTFTTAGCGTLVNIGTTAPITYIDNPSFSTCGGGNLPMTIVSGTTTTSGITTVESGSYCIETASLLQLEEYKKVFQSFWVRMIEQFVPATTIFVSGEKCVIMINLYVQKLKNVIMIMNMLSLK